MASPPKPWERLNIPSTTTSATTAAPISTTATTAMSTNQPPAIPERPEPLASTSTATTSPYSSSYAASPYSRFGTGYGGMGYGGYGMNSMYGGGYGYNSMYGSGMYGGGMYGGGMYGGMGMGMPGTMLGPNGQPSLTQTLESTTQHTFALLQSIVQTFSGVAQMLESTFMATHSSFFAMVGVIEQFGQLRNALGSVLGLFGLVRWAQDVVRGKTGLRGEFQDFVNGKPVGLPPSSAATPKPSKKPLIVFLLAIIGVPYAFTKLIRLLAARQQEQMALQQPNLGPLDASQLTFARALYQFTPGSSRELALNENEIVAITAKFDPRTNQEVDPRTDLSEAGGGEWWKGRTRDGREGWFPKKWVEVIERKKAPESSPS